MQRTRCAGRGLELGWDVHYTKNHGIEGSNPGASAQKKAAANVGFFGSLPFFFLTSAPFGGWHHFMQFQWLLAPMGDGQLNTNTSTQT